VRLICRLPTKVWMGLKDQMEKRRVAVKVTVEKAPLTLMMYRRLCCKNEWAQTMRQVREWLYKRGVLWEVVG
jgi:hypothetical protein